MSDENKVTEEWRDVKSEKPPLRAFVSGHGYSDKPYVLAVDAKGRMSVGYAMLYSSGHLQWTFAKPIGEPTHWMHLPPPPK